MKFFQTRPLLALLLLNILACLLFFYPILDKLNTILLASGGDGIKNYFTYLYYIRFDKGVLFTGMNYPFGEHMVFTDNMPLFAWTISKLKPWFPGMADHALGIMHSSFIIAYFIASYFLYRILRLYGVKGWWAVVSAIFITYFSPQFLRLFGHFGLSYSCFLPMLLYWIMQYERNRRIKYLVWIYITTILFTFCHVYYLAFSLILIAAYCFAYLVATRRPLLKKLLYCLPLVLSVAGALLTFNIYFRLTDTVKDRPIYPIGYLGAGVVGEDILTSDFNFIGANAFRFLFGRAASGSEGYTYLGIVSILVCLFLVYRVLRSSIIRIARRKRVPSHPVRRHRVWLITSLVVLLFSMGVPFVWGMDFLVDYVSTFRQFRSIGRFAWIFYYLMMIYSAVWLYRYTRARQHNKGPQRWIPVTAVLILAVYFIELNGYAQQLHRAEADARANYTYYFPEDSEKWTAWLQRQGYRPDNFQASIGLPYFHIGSEKLGLQNNDYPTTMFFGSMMSVHTGLGMMDVMMSRTSWSQSFESVRFFDGPFTDKTIATKFHSNKPFLLFVNIHNPLTSGESYMLRYATLIGSRNDIDCYSFDAVKMLQGDKNYTDSCIALAQADTRNEGLMGQDLRYSYNQHFDQYAMKEAFAGTGAIKANTVRDRLFLTVPVTHPTADTSFVFTTWMHCYPDKPEMPHIYYEQLDEQGAIIYTGDYLANHSTYITKDWYKAERIVTIKKETKSIRMYARWGIKEFIALDEVLIQPVNSIYFYKANDTLLMLNNRPVTVKKVR